MPYHGLEPFEFTIDPVYKMIMRFDPDTHHRKSIRLKGYDYSRPGAYFVTICTQNRACLFGEVVEDRMVLNDAGQKIHETWFNLPDRFDYTQMDESMVMPNHLHGIIVIKRRGESRIRPSERDIAGNIGSNSTGVYLHHDT